MKKRAHREKPVNGDAARPRSASKYAARRKLTAAADAGGDTGVWAADGEEKPFWETKRLQEMSPVEWDSLCDGCAQCCLVKIEDEDTAKVFLTRLSCSMLDVGTCRCKDYDNRFAKMTDCLSIDVKAVRTLKWLPES